MTYQQAVECIDALPPDLFGDELIKFAGVKKLGADNYNTYIQCDQTNAELISYISNHLKYHADRTNIDDHKDMPTDKPKSHNLNPTPGRYSITYKSISASINLFFESHQSDSNLYGVSVAHLFQYTDKKDQTPVLLRQKGGSHEPLSGQLLKIYNDRIMADLSIIRFDKRVVQEHFNINEIIIGEGHHNSATCLYGLKSVSTDKKIILTDTTLRMNGHLYERLYATDSMVMHGDSGSLIFNIDHSICYGLVIGERGQFTFINNLSQCLSVLEATFRCTRFYYLSMKAKHGT